MTAEDALTALARDLVEEYAAARAAELAREAGDVIELAANGTKQRLAQPGDWLEEEQQGRQDAARAFSSGQWEPVKAKAPDQVADEARSTRAAFPYSSEYDKAANHLGAAEQHLRAQGEDRPARAYKELANAHEHIVSKVVPYARPENYPDIAKHLQRIAGHMQDLDQVMKTDPQVTRKVLGTGGEVMQHAGEARREGETTQQQAQADKAALALAHQQAIAAGPAAHLQFLRDQGVVPPPTGAAAVHPAIGQHLLTPPGHSISGHSMNGMVSLLPPGVAEQQALAAQEQQIAERQQAERALKTEAARQAREERVANTVMERKGISPPGTYAPLSDEQFASHARNVSDSVQAAREKGMATHRTETLDGRSVWRPERATAHNEIVQQYLSKAVKVPSEGRAILLGGLPGSGKSSVLKQSADLSKYAVVNPDDIKEELASRGMVPEVKGLSPMEASTLVHREAGHIAGLVTRALVTQRKNVVLDRTMNSGSATHQAVDMLREHNYGVHGVYVHVPPGTAATRAARRYRSGLESYRKGGGNGSRYLPPDVIRAADEGEGQVAGRRVFGEIKPKLDSWEEWDNSEAKPRRIGSGRAPTAGPPDAGIPSVEQLAKERR